MILTSFFVRQSAAKPGLVAIAFNLYSMVQVPEYVRSVAGSDPGTCNENGNKCLPALSVCE